MELLLGLVQGLTEFLPVSSSGHIVLLGELLKVKTDVDFVVFLHLGTLAAVTVFALKGLKIAFSSFRFFLAVIISTLPAVFLGLLFEDFVDKTFSSIEYLPIFFCVTSVLLVTSDMKDGKKGLKDISFSDALIIGLFQASAIFPGISRSGATLAGAILLGYDPESSLVYSFLLAIPVIGGATLLKWNSSSSHSPIVFTVAFAAGLLALMILKKLTINRKLRFFSVYCLIMATVANFVQS